MVKKQPTVFRHTVIPRRVLFRYHCVLKSCELLMRKIPKPFLPRESGKRVSCSGNGGVQTPQIVLMDWSFASFWEILKQMNQILDHQFNHRKRNKYGHTPPPPLTHQKSMSSRAGQKNKAGTVHWKTQMRTRGDHKIKTVLKLSTATPNQVCNTLTLIYRHM